MKKLKEAIGIISACLIIFIVVISGAYVGSEMSTKPEITSNALPTKCCICGKETSLRGRITIVLDKHWYVFCPKCYEDDKIGTNIKLSIERVREELEKCINKKSRPYKAKVIKKLIDEY